MLFGSKGDTGVADDDGSAAGTIGIIHRFIDPSDELEEVIRAAVGFHSDYRLPEDLDVRTHAICDVVRDADKLDILRVASTDTVETVLNANEDELLASAVSPAIEDAFFEHRTAHYSERITPVSPSNSSTPQASKSPTSRNTSIAPSSDRSALRAPSIIRRPPSS